ncbi:HD domain-containing protein [Clostridium botulinum]|uniref:tRNA nucleotidyltransferase n=1 Tax=Clostridium botulinum TaxID=1491 RepID=A0A9Q1UYI4_CLOBO|nr:HD domain-containing protein [Clostridium botulinum]AEB77131.1 polyA polymerase family protein [Clostridium botulinum BKT015925]KEI00632.1 tRNA nucleotidyltransferase [Clostridium botulinum D str. 16868]KEI00754.1 tRNA nucleotidyltransferase [Clostridium botulinum C/D str. Sp77]KLU75501.1 tRNA nucleotidyltransferase [Clostridium botulinum V891]KOA74731.1 tRNA nucleotidyltransferase [Clostridium botulinum]
MVTVIEHIKDIIKNIEGSAYIIGEYIRNKLINIKEEFKGLDIIYDGDIELFITELKKKNYNVIILNKEKHIYRTIIDNKILNVELLKAKSIEEYLSDLDFTINSIALKLVDNKIIDPFNGRYHLKAKLIHPISKESIKEDPIRILTAYKISIKYGMHFSKICEEQIKNNKYHIKNSSKERIFNEFIQIIKFDKYGRAFEELDVHGVLQELLPYVNELKTIGKCRYHIEDAFTHMNLVYKNFKEILNESLIIEGLDLNIFNKYMGGFFIKDYFAVAAFCHDIGKVKCYKKNGENISFIGHEIEGSKIMKDVCSVLGFSDEGKNFITTLIEAHMYPLGLCKNNVKNYKKSFYKFFSRYDKYVPFILTLSYCDMHATKMLYDPDNEEGIFKGFLEKLFIEYKKFNNVLQCKIVDEQIVMKITKAKGIDIKSTLDEIHKKLYYEELTTKDEVIKYLKNKK